MKDGSDEREDELQPTPKGHEEGTGDGSPAVGTGAGQERRGLAEGAPAVWLTGLESPRMVGRACELGRGREDDVDGTGGRIGQPEARSWPSAGKARGPLRLEVV